MGAAEPSGRAHHQHGLSLLQGGAVAQQAERLGRVARHQRRRGEVQARGDQHSRLCGYAHIFGVPAVLLPPHGVQRPRFCGAPGDGDDTVSDLAVRDALADGDDHP